MKNLVRSNTIKVALMTLTVLAITLLGVVGGVSWTGVALADEARSWRVQLGVRS